ncbi:hypothetical protein AG1IA_10253 [Rhizoctonia solani AG-1 IA]|uniref:Uncharacterized protein n=1 Tax=Thanatephorus cucumeris (strain AG1-IA) TaxID=983506 RepID=L8WG74_THACA|nr:hypothetical protein AG1IA_10253 [Rhizoctonia solani AG-1 IA]
MDPTVDQCPKNDECRIDPCVLHTLDKTSVTTVPHQHPSIRARVCYPSTLFAFVSSLVWIFHTQWTTKLCTFMPTSSPCRPDIS